MPNPPDSRRTIERARRVLRIEADAVTQLVDRIDRGFVRAIDLLAACRGKVIVTGMGKSGIICRKIAATLTSTGTPAIFLHAAEAVHGDSGVFVRGDTVIAISSSGETEEMIRVLPSVKRLELPLIAMTGKRSSTLAKAADVVLDVGVAEEACPMGLAPTASTTAALAMGDALAVVLLERKGFGPRDFAEFHPGGALGRRFLQVADLMHTGADLPVVKPDTPLRDAVLVMTAKRLGAVGIVDKRGQLAGIITDGDLRRAWERDVDIHRAIAEDVMSRNPKTIDPGELAESAVALMERHSITTLFVTEKRKPVGLIHLHDLLKAEIV